MTSSLRHNDVITFKILSFTKISPIKEERFIDVSELKNDKLTVQNKKENFLFNINNRILKKLSITKHVFQRKFNIQT